MASKRAKSRAERFRKRHAKLTKTLKGEQKKAEKEAELGKLSSEISTIRKKRFERRTAPIRSGVATLQKGATTISKKAETSGLGKGYDPFSGITGGGNGGGSAFDPITGARVSRPTRKRTVKRKSKPRKKSGKRRRATTAKRRPRKVVYY